MPIALPKAAPRTAAFSDIPSEVVAADGVDGAYVHVPFCFHKCHYCDFYSFVDHDDRQPAYVRRLVEEIEVAAARWRRPLSTIFVGGGTPTLLSARLWRELLHVFGRWLPLTPDGEFTVEANPETVTREMAETLVDGGVTRVSVGAQSFEPRHLKTLERWHEPASVERACSLLRSAGVRELSLDLIFGIPGQTLSEWEADLSRALALRPDHLSCYALTYERGTPMQTRLMRGEFASCDEELEAAMYELAIERLGEAGFEHYEISNWARRDALGSRRCRHNLLYWNNHDWWAFGPSASGHVRGVRWKNVPRLGDWLASGPWPPVVDVERLDARGASGERFMLGLRMTEGMPAGLVDELLAVGEDRDERRAAFERHVANGLLAQRDGRWALTRRGLLLANSVIADLV